MPQAFASQLDPSQFDVVAIGASTGAPRQLETIFAGLPADLSIPVLVAQHLPPLFTQNFATALDRDSAMTVVHAEDGMSVFPGTAYIGRGKQHMRVHREKLERWPKIEISPEPKEKLYMPSADELFRTCAETFGARVLTIVMSGIGRDGVEGAQAVYDAGGTVLTQNEETCVVYGMPKACDEAGISSGSLAPEGITKVLLQFSAMHSGRA